MFFNPTPGPLPEASGRGVLSLAKRVQQLGLVLTPLRGTGTARPRSRRQ